MVVKKIIAYSDLHLNFALNSTKNKLISFIKKQEPDCVFISGDISDGKNIEKDLEFLAKNLLIPIYFVLGNHDRWHLSFSTIEEKIANICKSTQNLIYLTTSDPQPLTNKTCVIGADGWFDAALGIPNYIKYTADWLFMPEIKSLPTLKEKINAFVSLSYNYTYTITNSLKKALDKDFKNIYIITHFPPWQEATNNSNKLLSTYHLPYDINVNLGKALENIMSNFPDKNLIVICGHTHEKKQVQISKNILCKVIGAKYFGFRSSEEIILLNDL